MAEIFNLNRARKDKARADKDAKAAENRVVFGRTKAEKQKVAAEKRIADKIIDAHKREPD
jgi:hypothetical protein